MDKESTSQLLRKICAWAEAQHDIRALIVTGSQARGQADDLSDLDLEIVTRTPDRYVESDSWMSEISPVWVYLSLHNDQGVPTRLIIFGGGLEADFTVSAISAVEAMVETRRLSPLYDRGYRILVDKDQLAGKLPAASLKPALIKVPTQEEFAGVVQEFWFEVYHVAKCLKRDDLWPAKYRDWKLKELLLQVLEWREKSRHGWDYDTGHLGTRMKEWVDPWVWARLKEAFARFEAADSWPALHISMSVFRDLAQDAANRLGHRYSLEVDQQMSHYIGSLEAL